MFISKETTYGFRTPGEAGRVQVPGAGSESVVNDGIVDAWIAPKAPLHSLDDAVQLLQNPGIREAMAATLKEDIEAEVRIAGNRLPAVELARQGERSRQHAALLHNDAFERSFSRHVDTANEKGETQRWFVKPEVGHSGTDYRISFVNPEDVDTNQEVEFSGATVSLRTTSSRPDGLLVEHMVRSEWNYAHNQPQAPEEFLTFKGF